MDNGLHQARRDRWATPLATAVIACHFLAGLFTLGWYYQIVPRIKYTLDSAGNALPTDVILVIRLSDLLVNYWYVFVFVGPVMLVADFVIARWIARQLGLRVAMGFGMTVMALILMNLMYPYYILSGATGQL